MHEQVQITDIEIPIDKIEHLHSLAESMRSVKVWNISRDLSNAKRESTLHESIIINTFCTDSKKILEHFISKSDIYEDGISNYETPFNRVSFLDLTMQNTPDSLDILRKLSLNIENLLIKGSKPEDLEMLLDPK